MMSALSYPERSVHPYEGMSELADQGWVAADLHVHSVCSGDVLPAEALHPCALYEKARSIGMGFITLTDHDTMQAYEMLGQKEGLVTGVEIKVKDMDFVGHTIHINVYDLDEAEFAELEEIAGVECDLKAFVRFLKRNGLPFIYNHPFWFEPGERPNLKAIPEIAKLFPVVEYNMHRIRRKNELTVELAHRYGKGLVAATDTHSGNIGRIYTLSRGETFREYFRNIKAGSSYIVTCDLTLEDLINEINTWIGLIFDPDSAKPNRTNFSTGIGYLDRIVWALASDTLSGYPRFSKIIEGMIYRISDLGIPASIYLRKENRLVPEIEDLMASILSTSSGEIC